MIALPEFDLFVVTYTIAENRANRKFPLKEKYCRNALVSGRKPYKVWDWIYTGYARI